MPTDERTDEEIERLLVDRWLYRGGILALLAVFAILLTILGSRGLSTLSEQIVAGVLVLCGVIVAAVFVVMRQQDRSLFLTLRDRRRKRH